MRKAGRCLRAVTWLCSAAAAPPPVLLALPLAIIASAYSRALCICSRFLAGPPPEHGRARVQQAPHLPHGACPLTSHPQHTTHPSIRHSASRPLRHCACCAGSARRVAHAFTVCPQMCECGCVYVFVYDSVCLRMTMSVLHFASIRAQGEKDELLVEVIEDEENDPEALSGRRTRCGLTCTHVYPRACNQPPPYRPTNVHSLTPFPRPPAPSRRVVRRQIVLTTEVMDPMILHWGVARDEPSQWLLPDKRLWPKGTSAVSPTARGESRTSQRTLNSSLVALGCTAPPRQRALRACTGHSAL